MLLNLKTSVLPVVLVEVTGKVIITWAFALVEIFPAASFAHKHKGFLFLPRRKYMK
jgi:hypothetical protein